MVLRSRTNRPKRWRRTSGWIVVLGVAALTGVVCAADGVNDSPPSGAHRAGSVASPRMEGPNADQSSGFDTVRDGYLGILQQAARLDGSSIDAMADLQRRVYTDDALRGLAKLHRFQLSNATAMAARNPEIFQPIVWLHYETAGRYMSREDQPLRAPSYQLAADLATSMLRSARSDELRRFAVDIMLCTGYTFLGDGSRDHAVGVFDRVAQLFPGNGPALLGAAAVAERRGAYQDAVDRLKTLVASHPENYEARLRLAVNLARVDQRDASEAELRTLVAGSDQEWVSVVGFQELARRLMMRGQPAEAEDVLRHALQIFPGNHTLAVQLAVVLDARGRPVEAARVVEALQPEVTDRGASPRWRYSVWPAYDVVRHEQKLRLLAESSAPALEKLLQARAEKSS